MHKTGLLWIACVAPLLSGCHVSTPTYHLPQGYSESYRQLLQKRSAAEFAPSPAIGHPETALTLPPIPLEAEPESELEVLPEDGPDLISEPEAAVSLPPATP